MSPFLSRQKSYNRRVVLVICLSKDCPGAYKDHFTVTAKTALPSTPLVNLQAFHCRLTLLLNFNSSLSQSTMNTADLDPAQAKLERGKEISRRLELEFKKSSE
jgi:hypothetical protein